MRRIGPVILGIAVFLFFLLCYPFHIHFHEQYQLFLFSFDYFLELAVRPGGIAVWLARFLTQFFYYSWAGAVVIALLLVAVQQVFQKILLSLDNKPAWIPLSYLLPVSLWILLLNENYMIASVVSVLITLIAVTLYPVNGTSQRRTLCYFLTLPFLYWIAGGVSILYAVMLVIIKWSLDRDKIRKINLLLHVLAALALAFSYPMLTSSFLQYPLPKLILGIDYYRYYYYPFYFQYVAWAVPVAVLLIYLIFPAGREKKKRLLVSVLGAALTGALAFAGLYFFTDRDKERAFAYDYHVRTENWQKVLKLAGSKAPASDLELSAVNLALAKTGKMGEDLFRYTQTGVEGLFPPYRRDFVSPLITSEVFFHLGMVNSAQRYTFDAMEAIPDFQKSARCYKRLAETNLINGQYGVAGLYLKFLRQTLFYAQWAGKAQNFAGNGERIDTHPVWGQARRFRYRDEMLFSPDGMHTMLGILCSQNSQNLTARDYLFSYLLLARDLESFVAAFDNFSDSLNGPIPLLYQQALALYWVQHHENFGQVPWNISEEIQTQIGKFAASYAQYTSSDPAKLLRKEYGNTYWYYVFFTKNPRP